MEGGRRSWSIYGRPEINQRYEILERVGCGAYSDVYRARRIPDGHVYALKEVHDTQSAAREIEALQTLHGSPHVVRLVEYFWTDDEDAVLVLEFLVSDLASVIVNAKKTGGIPTKELKQWMTQALRAVDECHRQNVIHRDVKPSNFLVSADGILKLADFGQARMMTWKADAEAADVATCEMTSCVGTRWYRAPELLYGSTDYGPEVDLWALGCVLGELSVLRPIFPGSSDIDQLGRIFSVLGNLTKESWPGCERLPDYGKIYFSPVDRPLGLEACLVDRARAEVDLIGRLVRLDPAGRVRAGELLGDGYFAEEPLACSVSELTVPDRTVDREEGSIGFGSDSDWDVEVDGKGFCVRFD